MPSLPCLSDRSQLCGSYLWHWCLGQGMYSFFVCSRATVFRWNLYLWSWWLDLFWNTILLLIFTVRAQVWHNLCRRSRCCCRASLVGDRSTRTSANSRHLTLESSRVRPGAADFSSASGNLLIWMLKRVGLKLHPCLTPLPCVKKCVCFLPILTAHLFVYMDFIMSYMLPPTPLSINLYSRPSCQIESKAFLRSTKHEKTLPLFWFVCQLGCAGWMRGLLYGNFLRKALTMFWFVWLSIRLCRVNTWSVVR